MKIYQRGLLIALLIISNIGFILAYLTKHNVSIELIETINNYADPAEPYCEISTTVMTDSIMPCLVCYGMEVKKFEYCPFYIFTNDKDMLRDGLQSYKRTLNTSFFHIHPYYIEYENVPKKIYVYKLPHEYLRWSGVVKVIKANC